MREEYILSLSAYRGLGIGDHQRRVAAVFPEEDPYLPHTLNFN